MDCTYIRVAMAKQKVKMKDLALVAGISKSSLWRKMNGNTDFKATELKKIEKYLHLSE